VRALRRSELMASGLLIVLGAMIIAREMVGVAVA
jgi:hypothetical protein